MKTLLIHPKDKTTDFLKRSYSDKQQDPDWTILNDPKISRKKLTEAIKVNDRIIMLGHGDRSGLGVFNKENNYRYVINSKLVYLLREKLCVGIWCFASDFFIRYKLKGFCSGMIVFERKEADEFNVAGTNFDILESNTNLSECLAQYFTKFDIGEFCDSYRSLVNPIIVYNQDNFFVR